jgi:uncharacterized membrane protein
MREEKHPDNLISVTTAIVSLAGLLLGGGLGLIIGSPWERIVPVSLLCGLIGLVGGALAGFLISARDQKETNGRVPWLKNRYH